MNRTWLIAGVLLVLSLLVWRNVRLQQQFDRLAMGLDELRRGAEPASPGPPNPPAPAVDAPVGPGEAEIRLGRELAEARSRIAAVAKKNDILSKEKLDLEKQVASLTASLSQAKAEWALKKAEKPVKKPVSVAAEVPRVPPVAEAAVEAEVEVRSLTVQQARVLNVNKNLNMMVLNVGTRQGVKPGMSFKILRDDIVIGHAQAVDVRREVCGAMLRGVPESWPLRGDRAIPGKEEYGS